MVSRRSRSVADQVPIDLDGPCRAERISAGPSPGVAGRVRWVRDLQREHGWTVSAEIPGGLPALPWDIGSWNPGWSPRDVDPLRVGDRPPVLTTERCFATVLHVDPRSGPRPGPRQPGTGDGLLYRAACLRAGCCWEGEPTRSENLAVEDGCDHAWPGWRDLPVVDPLVNQGPHGWQMDEFDRAAPLYQAVMADWLETSGPIRTWRALALECRHHHSRSLGRWNLAVVAPTGSDDLARSERSPDTP